MNSSRKLPATLAAVLRTTLLLLPAVLVVTTLTPNHALAHDLNSGPDGHAPAGVMGDHTHTKGEWMFSYRFMEMEMDGNRDGTDEVSVQQVVSPTGDNFIVSPVNMTTRMHMFGAMFAPNDDVTVAFMLPYIRKEMLHQTRMGGQFTTGSKGFGDAKAKLLINVNRAANHAGHLNVGVSLPTGSIDERDDNPRCRMMGTCPSRLPYPMQLGSGTVDALLGYTHRWRSGGWSAGGQLSGVLRLGRNSQDYAKGNEYQFTSWLGRRFVPWLSGSLRANYKAWEDYSGSDNQLRNLPAQFIPTAREDLRAGQRLDIGVGFNMQFGSHRFGVEYLEPVYQDLDGPQLQSDSMLLLSYQISG